MTWLLAHTGPPFPVGIFDRRAATHRKTKKERQLADDWVGGGWQGVDSYDHKKVLYKSFNTLWCRRKVSHVGWKGTLIKKKTKFSSNIGKFRWDRVQSHK